MSHVPTVLKSDRSVFDKMLPDDDNGFKYTNHMMIRVVMIPPMSEAGSQMHWKQWSCILIQLKV